MKAGTLYAVSGQDGWIYYGQITPEEYVGFFKTRSRNIIDAETIFGASVMSVVSVNHSSITRALREGLWKKLGHFAPTDALIEPRPLVQWPVGTLIVTVFSRGIADWNTRVENPAIQDMELAASWDAKYHIPARLTADFGVEPAEWHVGGPVHRERRIKEEMAIRFPEMPQHALPSDWVATDVTPQPAPLGN